MSFLQHLNTYGDHIKALAFQALIFVLYESAKFCLAMLNIMIDLVYLTDQLVGWAGGWWELQRFLTVCVVIYVFARFGNLMKRTLEQLLELWTSLYRNTLTLALQPYYSWHSYRALKTSSVQTSPVVLSLLDGIHHEGLFSTNGLTFQSSFEGIVELHQFVDSKTTTRVGFAWFNGQYFVTAAHLHSESGVCVSKLGGEVSYPLELAVVLQDLDTAFYYAKSIPALMQLRKLYTAHLDYDSPVVVATAGSNNQLVAQVCMVRPVYEPEDYMLYVCSLSNTSAGDCGLPVMQNGKVVAIHTDADHTNKVNLHIPVYWAHMGDYIKDVNNDPFEDETEADVSVESQDSGVPALIVNEGSNNPNPGTVSYNNRKKKGIWAAFRQTKKKKQYASKFNSMADNLKESYDKLSKWDKNQFDAMGYVPGNKEFKAPVANLFQAKRKIIDLSSAIPSFKPAKPLPEPDASKLREAASSTIEVILPTTKEEVVLVDKLKKLSSSKNWNDLNDAEELEEELAEIRKEGRHLNQPALDEYLNEFDEGRREFAVLKEKLDKLSGALDKLNARQKPLSGVEHEGKHMLHDGTIVEYEDEFDCEASGLKEPSPATGTQAKPKRARRKARNTTMPSSQTSLAVPSQPTSGPLTAPVSSPPSLTEKASKSQISLMQHGLPESLPTALPLKARKDPTDPPVPMTVSEAFSMNSRKISALEVLAKKQTHSIQKLNEAFHSFMSHQQEQKLKDRGSSSISKEPSVIKDSGPLKQSENTT